MADLDTWRASLSDIFAWKPIFDYFQTFLRGKSTEKQEKLTKPAEKFRKIEFHYSNPG